MLKREKVIGVSYNYIFGHGGFIENQGGGIQKV